jgi:predicted nucleotidyltransferase
MIKNIESALVKIKQENNVRILYAVEAGSRAWGFASADSDYDVRFIYAHPEREYLRIDLPQQTIERMEGELDLAGWDLFKALYLFRKSNPPLMEWLYSPIVYAENTPQIEVLRDIARQKYSSSAVFHHYSRMAFRNYRQYILNKIKAGDTEVPLKKYLYVVRPMIALLYVEQYKQLPPTNFIETLKLVEIDTATREAIHDLIDKKQAGHELGLGPSIPVLNDFAEKHLYEWMEQDPEKDESILTSDLDDIASAILRERNISS